MTECIYPRCDNCQGIVKMVKEEPCWCVDPACDMYWQTWKCSKCGQKYERDDSS